MTKDPFNPKENQERSLAVERLEWEESAPDGQSSVEGFLDDARAVPNFNWLRFLLVAALLVLAGRLFYLQVVQGQTYRALAEGNRLRNQVILAPRGEILDRNGAVLAKNKPGFNLVATPADLPKEDLSREIQSLASLFGLTPEEIHGALDRHHGSIFDAVLIKQNLTNEQAILFETKAKDFVGFQVARIPLRDYQDSFVFSHALGYTGIVSESDLQTGNEELGPTDFIGKAGLELSYDSLLRGQNGVNQIEVDATGNPVKVMGTIDPEPGNNLTLTIDKELQQQLYTHFQQNAKSIKGAAIALNPKTGEVLALVSLPGFDTNLFTAGISGEDYSLLTTNPSLPLFNRAVSGTYAPGSTVKPMIALAALEQDIVTENTVIVDRGVLVIPNQFDSRISYNFYGWNRGGLGPMTIRSAIAQSSDIYFYTVGGGHATSPVDPLGPDRLADYYRKFQLGQTTGIDLQGEKTGTVADPAWKADYFKDDPILKKWYLGDTYHIAIGQGDMLVTPLQAALWTATIANNGVGMKPHLVQKAVSPNGQTVFEAKPEVLIKQFASNENIKIVQEGMRETVTGGSGRSLADLSIAVAGKTGTSQFDGSDPSRTHAWFTMYAPYEDPQIVITLLVEAGGEGHQAAATIVKPVLSWWAENRYGK